MSEQKNKCYYKGKFFENENDFWKGVYKYDYEIVNIDDIKRELDLFCKTIILNYEMGYLKITGRKLDNYFNECILNFFHESLNREE